MPKSVQIFALAFALVGGLALASPLYVEDAPSGPTKGSDMMGGGDMKGMMTQMSQMMQSSMGSDHGSYPNEQQRKNAPIEPEKKG